MSVHRHHDGGVQIGADVVERVGVDERLERLDGWGRLAVEVAVPGDAGIGGHLGGNAALVAVASGVVPVSLRQRREDGEDFDVGDFHLGRS